MKHTFSTLRALAGATYLEIIRDRLLTGILLAGVLVTASSFFLATVSLDQNSRILQNIGLASIHIFSLFIGIFVTANSVARDVDRRTLYLLFPKPISRTEYVIGKFLAMVMLTITTLSILGGLFAIGTFFTDRSLLAGIAINLGYSFLEITLLQAIALLFASFTAPLNAALYTSGLFIIGHSLGSLLEFAGRASKVLEQIISVLYHLLPNLDKFDVRQAVLYERPIPPAEVAISLVYWLVYLSITLALAVSVNRNREL